MYLRLQLDHLREITSSKLINESTTFWSFARCLNWFSMIKGSKLLEKNAKLSVMAKLSNFESLFKSFPLGSDDYSNVFLSISSHKLLISLLR